jgi:hypothetical protein
MQNESNLKQSKTNISNSNLHKILIQNPDLLDFCEQTGILEKVNELLNLDTPESKTEARNLITETPFPEDFVKSETLIIGNGDVANYEHGLERVNETGVDGIMIGRGIFKDPWAFLPREPAQFLDTKQNRIKLLIEHISQWQATWGNTKHFPVLKKFVKMYINSFANSAELRAKFMEMSTAEQMLELCYAEIQKT